MIKNKYIQNQNKKQTNEQTIKHKNTQTRTIKQQKTEIKENERKKRSTTENGNRVEPAWRERQRSGNSGSRGHPVLTTDVRGSSQDTERIFVTP